MRLDGEALRAIRHRTALTQKQVARGLEVPRELVSMWESGARDPRAEQIQELADVLAVPEELLAGQRPVSTWQRNRFLSEISPSCAREEVKRWLTFLDEWGRFEEEHFSDPGGPDKPPRPLDRGRPVLDARRAPTLADEVRNHYGLGRNALPNLWTFLDEHGVLACRVALGPLHEDPSVAGAFYNHERLGFCALINASASPGRQTFAMAHAYAHAIFHYTRRAIVCRRGDDSRVERFANAFASHLLVPRKKLGEMVTNVSGEEGLDSYKALQLASHFRVSYPTILRRLLAERHLSTDEFEEMRRYSPSGLARRIGLHPSHFQIGAEETLRLTRYPLSVLERGRRVVKAKGVSPAALARTLNVEEETVQSSLLTDPPEATAAELREYEELPIR